jgi:hypothetical protein
MAAAHQFGAFVRCQFERIQCVGWIKVKLHDGDIHKLEKKALQEIYRAHIQDYNILNYFILFIPCIFLHSIF